MHTIVAVEVAARLSTYLSPLILVVSGVVFSVLISMAVYRTMERPVTTALTRLLLMRGPVRTSADSGIAAVEAAKKATR